MNPLFVFRRLLILGAFLFLYVLAGKFGLALATIHESASAVWFCTGLAFTALLLLGYWVWPAVWIGAFIVNFTTKGTVLTSFGIASGNTLEAVLGVYLICRFVKSREVFDRTGNIFRYIFLAGMVSTAVSATLGVTSLSLAGFADWNRYGPIWVTWWLGNLVSNLLIPPFLVTWLTKPFPHIRFKKWMETVLWLAATFLISRIEFEGWLLNGENYPLGFLSIPVLIWAAFRFGLHGATFASLFMSTLALKGTLQGLGTFGLADDPNASVLLLQTFMATVAVASLVVATLLSERKDLEELKSEEKFRVVTETALDGIVCADQKGRIFYFNKAAEKMFGYAASEIFEKPITTLMPERFHEAHLKGFGRYLETGQGKLVGTTVELTGIRKDGKEFPLDLSLASWKVDQDVFFTAILRDISARKKAEQTLRESEERFRLIVEGVKDYAIFMLDPAGCITSWNQGAERIKGYQAQEAIGKHFSIFYPEEDRKRGKPEEELKIAVREGRVEEEGLRVRKGGSQFWAEAVLTSLWNEDGNLRGFAKITRDITERKKTAQALQEAYKDLERRVEERTLELKTANERLQKLDAVKTDFLLAASHELRTPLTAIIGYLKLMMGNKMGELNPVQRESMGHVQTAADRLHRLVNQMLNISRIESGQAPMEIEKADLRDLVKKEVWVFKAEADQKQITLDFVSEPGLPAIDCDTDKIREVTANLLSNALKYTPRQGKVLVAVQRKDDGVEVRVSDTGVGIKPEDQLKIFDPFYRTRESGLEGEASTGLGLALVRRIVEAHHGRVLVESEEGKGSVFAVFLPYRKKTPAP